MENINYVNDNKLNENNGPIINSDKVKTKIAILSSFTLNNFPSQLENVCTKNNLPVDVKLYTSYNLGAQELGNPDSLFSSFNPDMFFYFLDFKSYFPDYLDFVGKSKDEKEMIINEKINYLYQLINNFLKRNDDTFCLLHNFEVPSYSPLGIIDNKDEMGLREFVRQVNQKLESSFRKNENVVVLDYDLFLSNKGKENSYDPRLYFLADMKLHHDLFPALAEYYWKYIRTIKIKPKKCLVLDLDNTLWGGIIGEDGIDNIKLGPTPPGNTFLEFQRLILSLFHKGIVLAINSKNNPGDALEVLRKHPDMVLREEHFSAMRINWQDKATNIKEIAAELNIGTDSMVFIDDDKLNRMLVKSILPEVTVVDLPEDFSLYPKTLMELDIFNSLQLTAEDKSRGRLYAEERQRREFKSTFADHKDFLRSLEMQVEIKPAESFTIPRISQLTNRTNQFNLTTRRYTETDIKKMTESSDYYVCSIKSKDKLGDNGVVGVAILRIINEEAYIDTFLMSCRILGRSIEEALLIHIINKTKELGVKSLIGEYIPSKKNIQTKDFYKSRGFSAYGQKGELELWSTRIERCNFDYPDYITIIRNKGAIPPL